MAELVMKRSHSGRVSGVLQKGINGRIEAQAENCRRYYLDNPEKNKAYSRGDYYRQYYLLNKDKKSEYRRKKRNQSENPNQRRDGRTKEEYRRDYYLQNNERSVEYLHRQRTRYDDSRARYRQQLLSQHREKETKYHQDYYNRTSPTSVDLLHRREYNLQNKEKNTEYQRDYRNNDLSRKRRMEYLGKREYIKLYAGFERTNQSWRTPDIVREYFESVASPLNVSNIVDWYRISRRQMNQLGGLSLYDKFGSLGAALQYAYPEVQWDLSVFSQRGKKSGQRWLKHEIERLLPGVDVVEDYQHPDLNWVGDSDRNMELDLWLPQHRIGIEYQGEQHYYNIESLGPANGTGAYSERDALKSSLCESRGITLIPIPFWWDGSMASLSATLYAARPDVFPMSSGTPIPRSMPMSHAKGLGPSDEEKCFNIRASGRLCAE